jgi:hypothetical protein
MEKSNNKKRLLVHKNMPNVKIDKSIDIILTPQFYTYIKEELGVKFAYQAKQIAPSIFDDYLDDKEYQFFAYKANDYWHFFAYNIDYITQFLEEKGLKEYQIKKIFFAQELSSYINESVDLGDDVILLSIDDIVTILPIRLISSELKRDSLDLEEVTLKHGISLSKSYSSLIPLKDTIIISLLFSLLGGIFIAEGIRAKESIKDEAKKRELLLDRNHKLSSSRIRKSIISQYEPIDRVERLKRNIIDNISKLLNSDIRLKELILDDKKVSALIEFSVVSNIDNILRDARGKGLTAKKEGKFIRVERGL